MSRTVAGKAARQRFGWYGAHRFLLARRLVQAAVMMLFLLGPLTGMWILRGNLSSSRFLDTVPMTDPLLFLQTLAAGHWPPSTLVIGAIVVAATYLLLGGRSFCSWVCPLNPLLDLAAWLRRRLDIRPRFRLGRNSRFVVLAAVLLLPLLTGSLAWEQVNPVAALHRGIIFGMGFGWVLLVAVFLLDLALISNGWCAHLCPIGACYSQLGRISPLRVHATRRAACNRCLDCVAVCPEPWILPAPLFNEDEQSDAVINPAACTRCMRCVEICSRKVFDFTSPLSRKEVHHEMRTA